MSADRSTRAAMAMRKLTERQIAQRLAEEQARGEDEGLPAAARDSYARNAAVLVPLFRMAGEWRLLFIRRAESAGDYHSGQVAFPGGRLEPSERDATVAALREAREEIGLPPEVARILGRLRTFRTVSNFLVTPVVGHIPWPLELMPAPEEVSRIFSMPLAWLADPANHRVETRRLPGAARSLPIVYFRPYQNELLWGVSARITLDLVRTLGLYGARSGLPQASRDIPSAKE